MKRSIALGMAVIGGTIALRALSPAQRRRLGAAVRRQMLQRMERMMSSLPDDAPPKLVMSVLPRLRDQNDRIITMLEEQNALLREQLRATAGSVPV